MSMCAVASSLSGTHDWPTVRVVAAASGVAEECGALSKPNQSRVACRTTPWAMSRPPVHDSAIRSLGHCLLLRADAEQSWLSREVVPVLRQIERSTGAEEQSAPPSPTSRAAGTRRAARAPDRRRRRRRRPERRRDWALQAGATTRPCARCARRSPSASAPTSIRRARPSRACARASHGPVGCPRPWRPPSTCSRTPLAQTERWSPRRSSSAPPAAGVQLLALTDHDTSAV